MQRYGATARFYDLFSGEPVYGVGRRTAIAGMRLWPGARVLDLGCGTGLNLPGLVQAVGATGEVVGVDAAPRMLDVAAGKARDRGWGTVRLVRADVTTLEPAEVAGEAESGTSPGFDALLATYALSVTGAPEAAWHRARGLLRPGARVGVVDLAPPTGSARWAAPLARLAAAAGGADLAARAWLEVERDLEDVTSWSLRGGHVQVRVGCWPGAR